MQLPLFPPAFRKHALDALKPNLQTALMVCFLATLPSLLANLFFNYAMQPMTTVVRYYSLTLADMAESATLPTVQAMETLLNNALTEISAAFNTTLQAAIITMIAVAILTPVLDLGMLNHMLKLVRHEPVETRDVVSRMSCFLKAIVMNLAVSFMVFLWSLPGLILTFVSAYLMVRTNSDWFVWTYLGGMVLSIVLGIRAAFHYAMARLVMADHPEYGPLQAIRRSVQLMRTRKMDFFRIRISFIWIELLVDLAATMFAGITPVLGTTFRLAANLLLSLYIGTTIAVLYTVLDNPPPAVQPQPFPPQNTPDDDEPELN